MFSAQDISAIKLTLELAATVGEAWRRGAVAVGDAFHVPVPEVSRAGFSRHPLRYVRREPRRGPHQRSCVVARDSIRSWMVKSEHVPELVREIKASEMDVPIQNKR